MRATISSLFVALLLTSCSTPRPTGSNCNIAEAPDAAGEVAGHGSILRIYPRARDIGTDYNGCQSVWMQNTKGTTLGWLVWIQNGRAVQVWSEDKGIKEKIGQCTWEQGALKKGSEDSCPRAEDMIWKSYLPGCMSKAPEKMSVSELHAWEAHYCGDAE